MCLKLLYSPVLCVLGPPHIKDCMKRIVRKNASKDQELEDLLKHTLQSGDCMVWRGCLNTDGYPRMAGNVKVHRRVYELETGIDISGLVVRHRCDNPKCINPDHLEHGSQNQNIKDRDERNRTYRVITKEIVRRVLELADVDVLSRKEIAIIVGIDSRRVSDIINGLYSAEAKFLGRGIRRI